MIECEICKIDFDSIRGLLNHREHKLKAGYEDHKEIGRYKIVCHNCKKEIIVSYSSRNRFYCSHSCKIKMHKPNLGNKKLDKHTTCQRCGNDFSFRGNRNRKYCSRKCGSWVGINKMANDPKIKAKQSKAKKNKTYSQIHKGNAANMINKRKVQAKNNNNWKYATNYRKSPNKIEKDFSAFLDGILPNQYKFTGNKYNAILGKKPDFTHSSKNKIIEIFGDYWHRNDNADSRISEYNKKGYDCLVIWEHEFRETPELVLDKIKNF